MSTRDLFERSTNYVSDTNQKDAFSDAESSRNVNAINEKQNTFEPQIDYNEPLSFARFGSAELYYQGAIDRIIDFYPYDGSDAEYNEFHGSSKISISGSDSNVTTFNYTSWASFVASCSGSVLNYNNTVYRSFAGGIAPLMEDLSMNESARIGTLSSVYHAEIINNQIWFGITVLNESGYVTNEPGSVKVLDTNGLEIASYDVGINPGDFSFWTK